MIRATFGQWQSPIKLELTNKRALRGLFCFGAEGKSKHTLPDGRRRDWIERKRANFAHLRTGGEHTLLVSACDKLHTARVIVQDLEDPAVGTALFERFIGYRDGTLGCDQSLAKIFTALQVPGRVLDAVVGRMHGLVEAECRQPLTEK